MLRRAQHDRSIDKDDDEQDENQDEEGSDGRGEGGNVSENTEQDTQHQQSSNDDDDVVAFPPLADTIPRKSHVLWRIAMITLALVWRMCCITLGDDSRFFEEDARHTFSNAHFLPDLTLNHASLAIERAS